MMIRTLLISIFVALPSLAFSQMTLSEELGQLSGKSVRQELRVEKDARPVSGQSTIRTVASNNTVVTVQTARADANTTSAVKDSLTTHRPKDDVRVGQKVVVSPAAVASVVNQTEGSGSSLSVNAVTIASAELDLAVQRQARARTRLKTLQTDEKKTIAMYRSKIKKMSSTSTVTGKERAAVQEEMDARQAEFTTQIAEAERAMAEADETVRVKREYLDSLNAAVEAERKAQAEAKVTTGTDGK